MVRNWRHAESAAAWRAWRAAASAWRAAAVAWAHRRRRALLAGLACWATSARWGYAVEAATEAVAPRVRRARLARCARSQLHLCPGPHCSHTLLCGAARGRTGARGAAAWRGTRREAPPGTIKF